MSYGSERKVRNALMSWDQFHSELVHREADTNSKQTFSQRMSLVIIWRMAVAFATNYTRIIALKLYLCVCLRACVCVCSVCVCECAMFLSATVWVALASSLSHRFHRNLYFSLPVWLWEWNKMMTTTVRGLHLCSRYFSFSSNFSLKSLDVN